MAEEEIVEVGVWAGEDVEGDEDGVVDEEDKERREDDGICRTNTQSAAEVAMRGVWGCDRARLLKKAACDMAVSKQAPLLTCEHIWPVDAMAELLPRAARRDKVHDFQYWSNCPLLFWTDSMRTNEKSHNEHVLSNLK